MNILRSIVSLSEVRHTWVLIEGMPYLIRRPSHVRILCGIQSICIGKEALSDDMISKILKELNGR